MSARRCVFCGINYPSIPQFAECPIHESPNELKQNAEPDQDWKQGFARLQAQYQIDVDLTARPIPLVHNVDIVEDGERFFIDQSTLMRAGLKLSRMQNDQFYLFELDDGWVYETQGWDNPRRRWWVERVFREDLAEELGLIEPEHVESV